MAAIALALLIGREFLALGASPAARLAARVAGWGAVPFLLVFAVLFVARVFGFLSDPGA